MKKVSIFHNSEKMDNYRGKHLILDLYDCRREILNDKNRLDEVLTKCVELSGATIEGKLFKQFEPSGISAVFLLSESHLAMHSWPEKAYISIDMYTCGTKCDPLKIVDYIEGIFEPKLFETRMIERGSC